MKESVTEVSVTPATARSNTVPGFGTIAVNVIADEPLWPSLVAVIVAVPAATPLISPLPFTVATAGALLAQVTTRPLSGLPLASLELAASWALAPTCTLAVAGLTVTDATATGGGSSAVVPLATVESAPKTAFTFSVPRNATNWN